VTFGERAACLAGLAGAMFGWRPGEFWLATPEELASLVGAVRGEEAAPPDLKSLMERFPDG
jgi:hypothetical protein